MRGKERERDRYRERGREKERGETEGERKYGGQKERNRGGRQRERESNNLAKTQTEMANPLRVTQVVRERGAVIWLALCLSYIVTTGRTHTTHGLVRPRSEIMHGCPLCFIIKALDLCSLV